MVLRPEPPRSGRGVAAAACTAAAVAAVAVLAGCATARAGGTAGPLPTDGAPASVSGTASPTSAATAGPSSAGSSSAGPDPAGLLSAAATVPAGDGTAGRTTPGPGAPVVVTQRVVLPTMGTGPTASVSGTVRSGLNRCLYVTTDAGQRFAVSGALSAELHTALTARSAAENRVGAAATPAVGTPGPAVRIVASGTLSTGPSICGSRWTFTITRGSIG